MDEVFPVLCGVVLGLAAGHLSLRLRWLAMLIGVPLVGITASYISGELSIGWQFVLIDMTEVLMAFGLVLLLQQHRSAMARRAGTQKGSVRN